MARCEDQCAECECQTEQLRFIHQGTQLGAHACQQPAGEDQRPPLADPGGASRTSGSRDAGTYADAAISAASAAAIVADSGSRAASGAAKAATGPHAGSCADSPERSHHHRHRCQGEGLQAEECCTDQANDHEDGDRREQRGEASTGTGASCGSSGGGAGSSCHHRHLREEGEPDASQQSPRPRVDAPHLAATPLREACLGLWPRHGREAQRASDARYPPKHDPPDRVVWKRHPSADTSTRAGAQTRRERIQAYRAAITLGGA
mmetsp:Transcript_2837/g.6807  ORF Transcript_2837/g.6807 Transcript_2837/m.6807 type:complete len:263 (+) Transcript_2837:929-1717(+)